MARQGTGIDVLGFGAGETTLLISATIKVPIGLKERARRGGINACRDNRPGDAAMFTDVAAGDLIGDTLVAERSQQPIEYLGRVAHGNGVMDTGSLNISADIVQKCQRSCQATDRPNQLRRTTASFGIIFGDRTGIISLGRSARWADRS